MGLGEAIRRLFGLADEVAKQRAPLAPRRPLPAPTRAAPDMAEVPCPECGKRSPRGSATDGAFVAAIAAEVTTYGDEHRDESFWDYGPVIAEAHGLTVWDIADEQQRADKARDRANRPRVTRETIDVDGMRVLDLRHLDAIPLRLRGVSHYVTDRGRVKFGGPELVLKREPDNRHDTFAIAVYGQGRKIGYVSRGRANTLTPLLDRLDYDGFLVAGTVEQDERRVARLEVLLPRVPLLRAYVKELLG